MQKGPMLYLIDAAGEDRWELEYLRAKVEACEEAVIPGLLKRIGELEELLKRRTMKTPGKPALLRMVK